MNLAELLACLPPTGLNDLTFPRHLLGAFRRRSITFCTGVTDEKTVVHWFQSRSFTIDLRLPDGDATRVVDRQGWIGDTRWDEARRQLSWTIESSYQPRNQWPEPAALHFIGNSVIEFAPSGAYVEDWRQQSCAGPLLGLRLVEMVDPDTGRGIALDGGLIIAGEHSAYVQSRPPLIDRAMANAISLEHALCEGGVSERDIESYEVSVAVAGDVVTHSTQPGRVGDALVSGDFAIEPDGRITSSRAVGSDTCRLRFELDCYCPDFDFGLATQSSAEALGWIERERDHLMRHAQVVL